MHCQYAAASRNYAGPYVARMLSLPAAPQLVATYRYRPLRRATPLVLGRSLPLTSGAKGFRVLLLALVYLVLTEYCLILFEAKAPQPSCHVHSGAPIQGCGTSSCSSERVSRTFGRGALGQQCSSWSPRYHAGPNVSPFSVS